MMLKTLRSSDGFTYIGALVMVIIVGIMASRAAIVWKTSMQREKEVELIFRGTQYRDALRRFYGMSTEPYGTAAAQPGAPATTSLPTTIVATAPRLNELKDLWQPTLGADKKPFLRRLYLDPMTGEEFDVVKDANQRIIGVKSTSKAQPIKKANFPWDLEPGDFEDKKEYTEWQFICTRYPKPGGSGGVKGLNTTGAGGEKPTTTPEQPPVPPAPNQ